MSDLPINADQAVLQRRRLLRGSALVAAAAGGAVAATASGVLPASASPVPQYAVTFGVPPERVFDTKPETGHVVDSSPSALTSQDRLRKGAWIDVAVVPDDSIPVIAVVVDLTSYSLLKFGSLVVSTQGDEPTGTHAQPRQGAARLEQHHRRLRRPPVLAGAGPGVRRRPDLRLRADARQPRRDGRLRRVHRRAPVPDLARGAGPVAAEGDQPRAPLTPASVAGPCAEAARGPAVTRRGDTDQRVGVIPPAALRSSLGWRSAGRRPRHDPEEPP